jgi:hypothetical protein
MRHALMAALAALTLAGPALAQQDLTDVERQQLVALVGAYLDDVQQHFAPGLAPAAGFSDEIVAMQPGGDHRWSINLVGGAAYRIIGACDNECSDVDIELIDAAGTVVASDTLPDDYPIVDHAPSANGAYVVRMIMQRCTAAPCFAGARVLTEGGDAAASGVTAGTVRPDQARQTG